MMEFQVRYSPKSWEAVDKYPSTIEDYYVMSKEELMLLAARNFGIRVYPNLNRTQLIRRIEYSLFGPVDYLMWDLQDLKHEARERGLIVFKKTKEQLAAELQADDAS